MDATLNKLLIGRNIIERGWRQAEYIGLGGDRCMLGALMGWEATVASASSDRLPHGALLNLARSLPKDDLPASPDVMHAIFAVVSYNDAAGRTKDEILAVFDRAIAIRREVVIPRRKATATAAATRDTDLAAAGD